MKRANVNTMRQASRRLPWVSSCVVLLLVATVHGCAKDGNQPAEQVLRLATTTSTRDSGLLEVLLPVFQQADHCRIDVVAVGTGAALKLGEAGDADVVMVHAREAEEAFMAAGHGVRREPFMYNYFVLLGPEADPANIRDVDPIAALGRIAAGNHKFVSRGDDSGTHKRELSLWKETEMKPDGEWYIEAGDGMGRTLVMADEMQAYVLADTGTYLKFREKIDLVPLAKTTEELRNPYAVMVVNPNKHKQVQQELAEKLVDYLISAEAQQAIAGYRVNGQQLFFPTRLDDQPPKN